jgi:hypothetical protein
MRRRRPCYPNIGVIVCGLGILIILALTLPAAFWWFALGIALTCGGVVIIIKR